MADSQEAIVGTAPAVSPSQSDSLPTTSKAPNPKGKLATFGEKTLAWIDYFGEMAAGLLGLTESKYEMEHWEHLKVLEEEKRKREEKRMNSQQEETVTMDGGEARGEEASPATEQPEKKKIHYHYWNEDDEDSD